MELFDLPLEILIYCLRFLSSEELCYASLICSKMKDMCEVDILWRFLCEEDFGVKELLPNLSWKTCYIFLENSNMQMVFNRELSSKRLEIFANCARSPSFRDAVGLATKWGLKYRGIRTKYYFEVKIEAVLGVSEFGIGVATKGISTFRIYFTIFEDVTKDRLLGHDNQGWSLFCLTSSATEARHGGLFEPLDTDTPLVTGDVVGVLLNLREKTLSFFINGLLCGTPFKNLPEVPLYPAISVRFIGASVSIKGFLNAPKKTKKRPHDPDHHTILRLKRILGNTHEVEDEDEEVEVQS